MCDRCRAAGIRDEDHEGVHAVASNLLFAFGDVSGAMWGDPLGSVIRFVMQGHSLFGPPRNRHERRAAAAKRRKGER